MTDVRYDCGRRMSTQKEMPEVNCFLATSCSAPASSGNKQQRPLAATPGTDREWTQKTNETPETPEVFNDITVVIHYSFLLYS